MSKTKFKKYKMNPIHKDKYIGTYPIICRSSWEFKFAIWCDNNPNVLKWSSESVVVPYISPIDMKEHKYFVDNFMLYRHSDGRIKKYLIEIKPEKQTVEPVATKRKKKSSLLYEQATFAVNEAKWNAAFAYAQSQGWEFLIFTEKDLNIKQDK